MSVDMMALFLAGSLLSFITGLAVGRMRITSAKDAHKRAEELSQYWLRHGEMYIISAPCGNGPEQHVMVSGPSEFIEQECANLRELVQKHNPSN
jgi:hypothetical protein